MSCHMYNLKVSEWFLTASYAHIFWNILELFDYLEQLQTSLAPLHPPKCAGPPAWWYFGHLHILIYMDTDLINASIASKNEG